MTQQELTFKVKALLWQEEGFWVVQGLEYDIAAYGKSIEKAMAAFKKTFLGQIIIDIKDGKKPLQDVGKAPVMYSQKFNSPSCYNIEDRKQKPGKTFKIPQGINIPDPSIIETRICA